VCIHPTGAAAQARAVDSVVEAFYPTERLKPVSAAERQSCAAPLSQAQSGEPAFILAGYTDRASGAIRLLRRAPAGAYEVAFDHPDGWNLTGSRCTVRLRDLDLDGRPEVFVSFLGVRASTAWVFRWDGTALTNLTPTTSTAGRLSTLLLDPLVYDLDHTGALEVVAARDIERPNPTSRGRHAAFVYRLGDAGLGVVGSLLAIAAFRGDVDARSNLRSFRLLEDSTSPFTLRIVNGDRNGQHRAAGVTVRMNEVVVAEPADVAGATALASVALPPLTVQNHFTATIDGPPDATVIVVVEDSTTRR
jgi:hypothetical protein